MRYVSASFLALALGLLSSQVSLAGDACCPVKEQCGSDHHCGRCGCQSACNMVCQIVPDVKEVKKTVWVVKCEPFCKNLPGCPFCDGCGKAGCDGRCGESACNECGGSGCENGCNACGKTPRCVKPDCGKVACRKILEKKEITCKIPCWKCVPVYACGNCTQACEVENAKAIAAGAPAPAPAPKAAPITPAPKPPAPPKAPKAQKQADNLIAPLPPLLSQTE